MKNNEKAIAKTPL